MDPFYNRTATLYNRYMDDDGNEQWLSTLFKYDENLISKDHGVRLLITKGANISASGLTTADSAKLFVRMNKLPKEYKKPKEWQNLSVEDKKLYFTFQDKGNDFFVEGDTTGVEICSSFFSYMKETYDNCFKITTADIYNIIPHFEVGGE